MGRGLRPRGAYRARGAGAPSSRRSSAAEGALPRPRCPVKPRPTFQTTRAHPHPIRNPTQNCTNQAQPRHRKPPPSCSELQSAGVSRTLPCGCILNGSKPTSYGLAGRPRRDVLREQGRLHLTELIQQTVHELRRFIRGQHTRQTDSLRNCDSIRNFVIVQKLPSANT